MTLRLLRHNVAGKAAVACPSLRCELIGLFLFSVVCAGAVRYDDVTMMVEGRPQCQVHHGYITHIVQLENLSSSRTHQVTLSQFPYGSGGGQVTLGGLSRTVLLGPQSSSRIMIPAPAIPFHAPNSFVVDIDGRRQRDVLPMPYSSSSTTGPLLTGGAVPPLLFLTSRSIDRDPLDNAFSTLNTGSAAPPRTHYGKVPGGGAECQILRAEAQVSDWPGRWLAYSCYDAVILTAEDMARAPPATAEALWRYAECGGILLIEGVPDIPASWAHCEQPSSPPLHTYRTGFGLCIIHPNGSFAALPKGALRTVQRDVRAHERTWAAVMDINKAHADFPVVDAVSIPLGGIFVIMVIFAILAGPVNVLLLAKYDRRIWLYWTIPALSVVTTIGIVIYMLFSEGITPTARISGVTILDQRSQRATTLATNGFYCPLSPRDGLHYGYDTEVSPRAYTAASASGSAPPRKLDWTTHQHLHSGWVQPRVPAYLGLRRSENRNERLHIRDDGQVFTVVNGLGAPITRLLIADARGKVYECLDIPAGGQAAADPRPDIPQRPSVSPQLGALFRSGNWHSEGDTLTKEPETVLIPGTYIAWLDGTPFIENGLKHQSKLTATSAVYGCYDPEGGVR